MILQAFLRLLLANGYLLSSRLRSVYGTGDYPDGVIMSGGWILFCISGFAVSGGCIVEGSSGLTWREARIV
jgi:hypothetical protein